MVKNILTDYDDVENHKMIYHPLFIIIFLNCFILVYRLLWSQ